MLRSFAYGWISLFLLAGLSACGQEASAKASAQEAALIAQTTLTATPSNTLPPPPVMFTVEPTSSALAPSALATVPEPSFTLPDSAQPSANFAQPSANVVLNTPTPIPTAVILPTSTATAVPPTPTNTNTPMPTFTPPALPHTSPDEHYWLRRPVAEGGVVWTNKIYPYGSTRGGTLRTHHGVEFDVDYNTEIFSVASGTVRVAGSDLTTAYGPETDFYGNLVVIELDTPWHNQPVFTLYGHLNKPLVSVGQHVNAEELIGLSGATGVADGPHMHFEVRIGANTYDNTRNPFLWLYPFPDRGVVAGRVTWANGSLVNSAPVSLRRLDAESRYAATETYADNSVHPDDVWLENFAFDDVTGGYYEVVVESGGKKYKSEVWVYPYQTSFVEITLPTNP